VTDSSCQVTVLDLVARADTIQHTLSDMQAQKFTAHDRKYLIWMDANVLCGIGESYRDERPTSDNYNDGPANIPAMIARIDEGCWGLYDNPLYGSVEAHELTHTLGAVLGDAPHATKYGHCTDRYDVMCYVDGPGTVLHTACPPSHEQLLDCNHDDYFSTAPAKGSWLATHWNTANNSFLLGGSAPIGPPPPPPPTNPPPPPPPTIPPPTPTTPKCIVPSVKGAALFDGVIRLLRSNCALKKATNKYSRKVTAGHIISQVPTAGTVLSAGGTVSLVVSKGTKPRSTITRCVVPAVTGRLVTDAMLRIVHAGCIPKVKQAYSKRVPLGRVISQYPKRRTILPLHGTVTVVVSRGRKPGG
jgi:hypothetical protein